MVTHQKLERPLSSHSTQLVAAGGKIYQEVQLSVKFPFKVNNVTRSINKDREMSTAPASFCGKLSPRTKVVTYCSLNPPSLSPKIRKLFASTDTNKTLTFLQNARELNIPVRSGKWNLIEEQYLRKLVKLFSMGLLENIEPKTSMRSWLSKMLNCCPMRISKKQMHGEKFRGKAKFRRNEVQIHAVTQAEYDAMCTEVTRLRCEFLIQWVQDEFRRKGTKESTRDFKMWYTKAIQTLPKPVIARNDCVREISLDIEQETLFRFIHTFELKLSNKRANSNAQSRNSKHCKRARAIIWDNSKDIDHTLQSALDVSKKDRSRQQNGCSVHANTHDRHGMKDWTFGRDEFAFGDCTLDGDQGTFRAMLRLENDPKELGGGANAIWQSFNEEQKKSYGEDTVKVYLDPMEEFCAKYPSPSCIDFGLPSAWDFGSYYHNEFIFNPNGGWEDSDFGDSSLNASESCLTQNETTSELWPSSLLV